LVLVTVAEETAVLLVLTNWVENNMHGRAKIAIWGNCFLVIQNL
jgi:hypothetical protein